MKLTTTFKLLRKAGACESSYRKLRKALKGVKDTESINLLTILDTLNLDDALWALRATEQNCARVASLMAADFRDYANGMITTGDAVWDARDAVWAAREASAAAGAAAREAAEAAGAAAREAAEVAAWATVDATWATAARAAWAAWDAFCAATLAVDAAVLAVREKQAAIFRHYLKD